MALRFLAEVVPEPPPAGELLVEAAAQLCAYFEGRLRAFRLPLAPPQGTAFQREVWHALASVPFGRTVSYGGLAGRLGRPGAARAVGRALAANPLPILIPCHRVIAADGSEGGYSGPAGVKRWLLEHEGG